MNNIRPSQRGLSDNVRHPLVSHKAEEIDKRLQHEIDLIRALVSEMFRFVDLGLESPENHIKELNQRIRNYFYLVKHRIQHLQQVRDLDYQIILVYIEELDRVPYIDENWRRSMIDELLQMLIEGQNMKLAWILKKLQTHNHPVWHKAALNCLVALEQLGEITGEITAQVEAYISQYQTEKMHRTQEFQASMLDVAEDHSRTYSRIQQHPEDEIFARENIRGTADRGI